MALPLPALPVRSSSKTHAFFSSPFPRSDLSETMATDNTDTPTPPRSLTADFFSTPVRTPSPPPSTTTSKTKTASLLAAIHPSRIFPSRYTSRSSRDDVDEFALSQHNLQYSHPTPIFLELADEIPETEGGAPPPFSFMPTPHAQTPRTLSSLSSISTSSSSESTHSSSSLGIPESSSLSEVKPSHRLPTPPPPEFLANTSATPRPKHVEPRFAKHRLHDATTTVTTTDVVDVVDVDPAPGCIITTDPPTISPPQSTASNDTRPILTITPPPDTITFPSLPPLPPFDHNLTITSSSTSTSTSTSAGNKLRLIHPLGQGAFSSVWLAEDLSLIPLTFRYKQSIQELRRKASSVASGCVSRKSSGRSVSGSGSGFGPDFTRSGSLRMQNLRARVKGTRPVGFNTRFLDERHGEMGTVTNSTAGDAVGGGMILSPPLSASNSTGSTGSYISASPGPEDGSVGMDDPSLEGVKVKRHKSKKQTRLVAVKMTPRRSPAVVVAAAGQVGEGKEEEEERTRVGFVREVEILKHISHPNITVLLEHLSTPSHHILVLPYLRGGDLLGLVNSDISWSKLGENVLRRIWCELCKAVGWMHGVGLVHRDIKLENILLTTKAFSSLTTTSPRPTLSTLPETPTPLIKLTDFGLSRFIELDESTGEAELLWTRCGSEAYAAPELVLGTGSVRAQAQEDANKRNGRRRGNSGSVKGFYDARETDAWACGVVLYALVGRRLPFGEGVSLGVGGQGCIGGDGAPDHGHGRGNAFERRQWLMRIARGEYDWPSMPELRTGHSNPCVPAVPTAAAPSSGTNLSVKETEELVGRQLVHSEGAKRIVNKLMVRDPRRRARIMDLWEDEWMWGPGGGLAVGMTEAEWRERDRAYPVSNSYDGLGLSIDFGDQSIQPAHFTNQGTTEYGVRGGSEEMRIGVDYATPVDEERFFDEEMGEAGEEMDGEGEVEEVVDGEEGWLLDHEGIGSVARQELV